MAQARRVSRSEQVAPRQGCCRGLGFRHADKAGHLCPRRYTVVDKIVYYTEKYSMLPSSQALAPFVCILNGWLVRRLAADQQTQIPQCCTGDILLQYAILTRYFSLPLQGLCVGCRGHQACIMSSRWPSRGERGAHAAAAAGSCIMSIRRGRKLRETTETRRVYGTPAGRPKSAADAHDVGPGMPRASEIAIKTNTAKHCKNR